MCFSSSGNICQVSYYTNLTQQEGGGKKNKPVLNSCQFSMPLCLSNRCPQTGFFSVVPKVFKCILVGSHLAMRKNKISSRSCPNTAALCCSLRSVCRAAEWRYLLLKNCCGSFSHCLYAVLYSRLIDELAVCKSSSC